MRCRYCKGQIGFWRSLTDRQFCSSEHRRRGTLSRAKLAREAMIYGDEDLYEAEEIEKLRAKQRNAKIQAQIIVVLSTVMIAVLAFSAATGGGTSGGGRRKTISLTGEISKANPLFQQFQDAFKSVVPSGEPVRIHEDFQAGIREWVGTRDRDWSVKNGLVRPGRIRVWKPSMALSDYRFEFEGQIERNAMSWAFRAPDTRNYYATKIVVRRNGNLPSADIVRYTVLNGAAQTRTRLPLPVSIRPDTLYNVQVSVRGEQFVTKVNGQVVDVWSDNKLKRGGIGFFADAGERSNIHWADVREERDGIFGRLFAMGFFVPPYELLY
ncbi:MAG: hypothetical protein OHK0021_16340 [Bryobacter sp.]